MRTTLSFALALLLFCADNSYGQEEFSYASSRDTSLPDWAQMMYGRAPDAGAVVTAYERYYTTHPFEKNAHTQYYKRWLRALSRELPPPSKTPKRRYSRSGQAQWTSIGPVDWDHAAVDRSYAPGAAHVYTVEQSKSDPDILFAGTATSGIWKTEDRGLSWQPVSEDFRSLTVTALEISHADPDIVYAELLSSVYKTQDGGVHWLPTGDENFQALALNVTDIRMHPSDTSIVYAATQLGLYRTEDSGSTWTNVLSGDIQEIEFHPTDFDTVYAVKKVGDKTEFYRSLDGGDTFQLQSTGWPNPDTGSGEHQRRTELAVSPAAPDNVYALATGVANGGSGLFGVYVSTDAGATWGFSCCGPQPAGPPSLSNQNLMGWSDDGTDDGGQYYYDLAFAVSPSNPDSMYVAGVNLWVSGDGGQSFVCPAKWSHPYKPNYVHADIHDVNFYEDTHEIWLACDGGIFYSPDDDAHFYRRMTGISGTDFWGFGEGFWDGEVMLGGTYHNGTLLKDDDTYENGWVSTDGGDNYRGFVNPGNPREAYSDYNIKTLSGDRTVNNATRSFNHKPNASYTIGQSSDMLFHPWYYGYWYSGSGSVLWKTEDDGYTFSQVHDFGMNIAAMDIAKSDPDVIYVCTWPDWWGTKRIYRTTDAGNSWVEITPSSAVLNGNTWVPYDITVDATDAMKIWIVRTSMYGDTNLDGYAVFKSGDGGANWTNITTSALDNEAFTCIVHQAGTHGGVYVGTRETVYYRNDDMGDWEWFGDGLPAATFATRLIPYYREGKLRNGTNRSVWESPLYENSSPVAQPALLGRQHNCVMDTVYYVDHSIINENGATWFWQFPGGTPSTSTLRNPKVVYNAPGIYSVSLNVSDVNGSDSTTVDQIIEVRNVCALDTIPGRALKCVMYPDYAIIPDLNLTTNTVTISAWVKPAGIQSNYAAIVMSDGTACGFNFRESNNTLGYHWAGSSPAWQWDSNLEVPADQWSHVAIVVGPSSVKLYVNGREAVHNISLPAVTLHTMKIGSYQAWQTRNFNGLIDEVCIWNRCLSIDEIRALRHLIKIPEDDPDLVLYYQFNEENSLTYDKAGNFDGIMNGGAQKVRSRVPVGSGVSEGLTVNAPGEYDFDDVGLSVTFPSEGNVPDGDVYATRLYTMPDSISPDYVPLEHGYWILNNYGANQEFAPPDSIKLENLAFVSSAMRDSLQNTLHMRGENAEIDGWYPVVDADGDLTTGQPGSVRYDSIASVFKNLGQFVALRDSMPYGRASVTMVSPSDTTATLRGAGSAALLVKSTSKGLMLPRYTSAALSTIPSPVEGSLVYVTDLNEMACFDGTQWQILWSEYLIPPVYAGLPESNGFSLGGGSTAGAMLSFGTSAGVIVLPSVDAGMLTDITYPKEGLLIYRTDHHSLAYYDGVDWIEPGLMGTSVSASTEAPTADIPGMRIGAGTKDPNALLHLMEPAKGLAIPVLLCTDVMNAQEGLLIFDPALNALSLFDGLGWKIVK